MRAAVARPRHRERAVAPRSSKADIPRPTVIRDAAFRAAARPEVVVHLAALAGVRPSIADPAPLTPTSTSRARSGCSTRAGRSGVTRLAFASSSSVYGARQRGARFARAIPACTPLSPYAATKRAGELITFTAHHLIGLGVTNLRFFTVYGPRQRPDLAIHKFTRLIAAGKPIELFGDGSTSRDYTWVDDIIDGCVAAIDSWRAMRVPALPHLQPRWLADHHADASWWS